MAVDPADPQRVYVGTFGDGVYRTLDGGTTWAQVGDGIPHKRVLSVAISPCHRANGRLAVYVGTEPSNLYRSEDDGASWQALPALTELPSAPTWSFPPRPYTSRASGSRRTTTIPALPRGDRVGRRDALVRWWGDLGGSQAWFVPRLARAGDPREGSRSGVRGGGDGVALSVDGGDSWSPVDAGMDRHYSWGLRGRCCRSRPWYVSASYGARYAHDRRGNAQGSSS
ncbi:MAG: hypothetical protein U0841_08410 [Chloroflexia bacterium]